MNNNLLLLNIRIIDMNKSYDNKPDLKDKPGLKRDFRAEKYENMDFPLCPDVSTSYEKIKKIGQGTFGLD